MLRSHSPLFLVLAGIPACPQSSGSAEPTGKALSGKRGRGARGKSRSTWTAAGIDIATVTGTEAGIEIETGSEADMQARTGIEAGTGAETVTADGTPLIVPWIGPWTDIWTDIPGTKIGMTGRGPTYPMSRTGEASGPSRLLCHRDQADCPCIIVTPCSFLRSSWPGLFLCFQLVTFQGLFI